MTDIGDWLSDRLREAPIDCTTSGSSGPGTIHVHMG